MSTRCIPDPVAGLRSILDPGSLRQALAESGIECEEANIDRIVDTDSSLVAEIDVGRGPSRQRFFAEFVNGDVAALAAATDASLAKSRRAQLEKGTQGVIADPSRSMLLRPAGLDERLQGLDLLHNPERADGPLGHLVGTVRSVELLGHRLGKRAVIRISGSERSVIVKLMKQRSDLGTTTYRVAQGFPAQPLIPRPLGILADRNGVVWEDLGGVGVSQWDPLPAPSGTVIAALRRFHRVRPVPGVWRHGSEAEIGIVRRHAALIAIVRPDLDVNRAAADVCEALSVLATGGRALIHRDLHPGQIVADGSSVRFLDLDTVAIGDPAVDVGNLVAHLDLRGDDSKAQQLIRRYRGLEAAGLEAWRSAARFRLAAQRALTDASIGWDVS